MSGSLPCRRRNVRPFLEVLGRGATEMLTELLWPTRCAVCDRLGSVLCPDCCHGLPAIDLWAACPLCGAPQGRIQCCECNPVLLQAAGIETLAMDQVVSVFELNEQARRVVVAFKDEGELRLAREMAQAMARYVSPEWVTRLQGVIPIPASEQAYRRRGYDHGELLAEALAQELDLPCLAVLDRPSTRDQRALGRAQRLQNMATSFQVSMVDAILETVLVVDDVYTTGATLHHASTALRAAGVQEILGVTFART